MDKVLAGGGTRPSPCCRLQFGVHPWALAFVSRRHKAGCRGEGIRKRECPSARQPWCLPPEPGWHLVARVSERPSCPSNRLQMAKEFRRLGYFWLVRTDWPDRSSRGGILVCSGGPFWDQVLRAKSRHDCESTDFRGLAVTLRLPRNWRATCNVRG